MHKQLPAIILAVVIIAAIIGAVIIFKTPGYGKAAVMPRTVTQRLPTSTPSIVTSQPVVYPQTTAARTVTSAAPHRIQSSELTKDFYNKLILECQQKTTQLYTELLKKAEGSGSITGMQVRDPFNSPLFDQKFISTIALVDVELRPGTTVQFGCGADIGMQDLFSGNFGKGTYGISISLIGLW